MEIPKKWYLKYIPYIILFTGAIAIFSLFMAGLSAYRDGINDVNYTGIKQIYNGPLIQQAPALGELDSSSTNYRAYNLTPELAKYYADNTNLSSTNGQVKIFADFVKKGLVYQPTFKTEFQSDFVLKNKLDKESAVSFDFPFPSSTNSNEISNAKLLADGVLYPNAKAQITSITGYSTTQGLHWEGKVPANSEVKISISYNTVGISQFEYEGIENSQEAQDFNFSVNIIGTRAYDVLGGLSVDKREFGDNQVTLTWSKNNLFSKPSISIAVGSKINPSDQVSRSYIMMAPIYIVFATALIFLAKKFSKGIRILDLTFITILYIVFFPLFHYLTSFSVDPTTEIFANMNVGYYSMPLYVAFALAFVISGGLAFYLLWRTVGKGFATKLGIPLLVLSLGFFPLVATIPEYFVLLTLIGLVAIIVISMQVRLSQKID